MVANRADFKNANTLNGASKKANLSSSPFFHGEVVLAKPGAEGGFNVDHDTNKVLISIPLISHGEVTLAKGEGRKGLLLRTKTSILWRFLSIQSWAG